MTTKYLHIEIKFTSVLKSNIPLYVMPAVSQAIGNAINYPTSVFGYFWTGHISNNDTIITLQSSMDNISNAPFFSFFQPPCMAWHTSE